MRNKLIELLNEADNKFGCFNAFCTEKATEEAKSKLLDYLLENGVIVTPCVAMVDVFAEIPTANNEDCTRTPKERGGEK